jgi:hypothetical protein
LTPGFTSICHSPALQIRRPLLLFPTHHHAPASGAAVKVEPPVLRNLDPAGRGRTAVASAPREMSHVSPREMTGEEKPQQWLSTSYSLQWYNFIMNKKLFVATIGTLLIAVIFIAMNSSSSQQASLPPDAATNKSQQSATNTPPKPSATSTDTQLHGDIHFLVKPAGDQSDGIIITNDQDNIGDIKITNTDKFAWKECTVGLDPTVLAVDMGDTVNLDYVGDMKVGESTDVTALTLGMKEDDFRVLSSLELRCTNGVAEIDNIGTTFNKIAPLKTYIND